MTESLYSQIAAAEDALRASQAALGRADQVREALAGIVGRAEGADGRVVVECTPTEGLTALELDPKAMRMASADLAAAIKATIVAAGADMRSQIQRAMADVGAASMPSADEVREQLTGVHQQFLGAARAATAGLSDAQRLLNDRGRS